MASAAAAVQSDLKELKTVCERLKKVNAEAKELRNRKKELDTKIRVYIIKEGLPGIRYDNLVLTKVEKTQKKSLKKKEKYEAVEEFLNDLGVKNPKEQVKELFENVMKSEEEETVKLKIDMGANVMSL